MIDRISTLFKRKPSKKVAAAILSGLSVAVITVLVTTVSTNVANSAEVKAAAVQCEIDLKAFAAATAKLQAPIGDSVAALRAAQVSTTPEESATATAFGARPAVKAVEAVPAVVASAGVAAVAAVPAVPGRASSAELIRNAQKAADTLETNVRSYAQFTDQPTCLGVREAKVVMTRTADRLAAIKALTVATAALSADYSAFQVEEIARVAAKKAAADAAAAAQAAAQAAADAQSAAARAAAKSLGTGSAAGGSGTVTHGGQPTKTIPVSDHPGQCRVSNNAGGFVDGQWTTC